MDRVAELLRLVGLRPEYMQRFPHAFSGRAAPADRHRAGPVAEPAARRGGRAGLGARRLGAGADPEPAPGPAGAPPPDLPLRRPRPRRGQAHLRPGGRDVRGQARGARRERGYSTGRRGTRTPRRSWPPRPWRTRGCASGTVELPGEVPSPANPAAGLLLPPPVRATRSSAAASSRPRFGSATPGHLVSCHRAEELTLKGIAS